MDRSFASTSGERFALSCRKTSRKKIIDNDDLSKRIDPPTEKGLDIHKAIGKLPKPKSGWTLPGHKYTGPYNDLEKQVKYNPKTGKILEIYDQPTGTTDAIAYAT